MHTYTTEPISNSAKMVLRNGTPIGHVEQSEAGWKAYAERGWPAGEAWSAKFVADCGSEADAINAVAEARGDD